MKKMRYEQTMTRILNQKRMEDMRGELVVIAAGYPDNMRAFLEANPGLKSRFDRKMEFRDYSPSELLAIAAQMLKLEDITMDPGAEAHLAQYFEHLYQSKNKFFGMPGRFGR